MTSIHDDRAASGGRSSSPARGRRTDIEAGNDLVSLLRRRAEGCAEDIGYSFLGDGERETARFGFAQLHRAALILAARLQATLPVSKHVILAYPPGLGFIVGFFGCLYADLVPVPVALPHPRKPVERLAGIAADCGAKTVLSDAAGCRVLAAIADVCASLRIVETALDAAGQPIAVPASPKPDEVAFLQYTSGSTGAPRGVRVTHANVLANLAAIQEAERNGEHSQGVSWLPAHHDMGLIEGILQPLYVGYPTTLLPHGAFLQRPLRWLQAISRRRATVSGGPNFAFDACVRRIGDADLALLDLSSWEVAYCGAEPVHAETMSQFAAKFRRCGFRASALRPVFGLAEATLLVSASDPDAAQPKVTRAVRADLERGHLVVAHGDEAARALVSCGKPARDTCVRIVDVHTLRPVAEDRVGEIWVSGTGVAAGYHGPASRSSEAFVAADLGDGPARWLRTGDLGSLHAGELYVTGRRKDVLIVRGRKLHPQDIEHSIQRLDPHRVAGVAVVGCEDGADEKVIALVEIAVRKSDAETGHPGLVCLADELRAAVYGEHDIALDTLAFVRQGALARTTSGKLMRFRCRRDYLRGTMPLLACFDARATGRV